jgi:ubiquinone/menaquinone biosynthesis C-methylase UbiE
MEPMQRVLEPEYMDTAEEADGYDAMDNSGPNAAFVERLVELGATGRMLDLGTGPGHIPLLVCDRLPSSTVVGLDAAEHMLRHARHHLESSPHRERVTFVRGDAKALRFEEGEFDAVYSNTILHHIPDPLPFLREARRVLRPGGVLLIRDLFRPETEELARELVALHAADETPQNRELLRASLCAAFTPDELRSVADEAGLSDAQISIDSDRHMSLQLAAR